MVDILRYLPGPSPSPGGFQGSTEFQTKKVGICSWRNLPKLNGVFFLMMSFHWLNMVPSTMQVGCNVLSSPSFSWETSSREIASIAAALLVSWQHLRNRFVTFQTHEAATKKAMTSAFGPISGGHFNPSVSVAMSLICSPGGYSYWCWSNLQLIFAGFARARCRSWIP